MGDAKRRRVARSTGPCPLGGAGTDLYHFTARKYLPSIARRGLWKGDVPLTDTLARNGVWLTTDPRPEGHGLSEARQLTDREKRILGVPAGENVRFADKRAVRFKVRVPDAGGGLVRWSDWGSRNLAREHYLRLRRAGGHKQQTWHVFFGEIPPDHLIEAVDLRAGGPLAGWPGVYLRLPAITGADPRVEAGAAGP